MAKQALQSQQPTNNRIPSGYDGAAIPDFNIPACGISDVDTAIFKLFDEDNPAYVSVISDEEGNSLGQRKVPVVFATGERFALRQRNNPIRDKTGALILPIISIRRTGLDQSYKGFGGGFGLAQTTGDLVIKRRLSEKDPEWQNLINKQGLREQDNAASVANFLNESLGTGNKPGRLATRRDKFPFVEQNLKTPVSANNIYEIITIPFPTFYQAMYEVVIWTSYTQHMNEIVQRIMRGGEFKKNYRIDNKKGYWFVAYFDDEISSQDNLEEFTEEARVHKSTFTISVPAWMIANKDGGDMVPFRRYLSAPQLSFGFVDGIFENPFVSPAPSGNPDDFILSDVENLDASGNESNDRNTDVYQRRVIKDPFSGKEEEVFVRIKQRNGRTGETVISAKKLYNVEIP